MPRHKRTGLGGLGRRTPTDFRHVERYGYAAIAPETVAQVEKRLLLPSWHAGWDQLGGSCVGHGSSMMMSILNEVQARASATKPYSHRYDPYWLWDRAKEADEWPDTNPGDDNGTSVRAACDVLRLQGHVLKVRGKDRPPSLAEGIVTNRWITTVDGMRTAIANGLPSAIGVTWWSDFSLPSPGTGRNELWIGRDRSNLGEVEGGHCVCVIAASDRRQAFLLKNSWGTTWGYHGTAWIPYATMQVLLDDSGEATVVTDR